MPTTPHTSAPTAPTSPPPPPDARAGLAWGLAWLTAATPPAAAAKRNGTPAAAATPPPTAAATPPPQPPGPPSAEGLDPCDPRRFIPADRLDEAHALDELGQRRAFSRAIEALFVEALEAWLQACGPLSIAEACDGLAWALDISPETTRRYLRKHAHRWGRFRTAGRMVHLRDQEDTP